MAEWLEWLLCGSGFSTRSRHSWRGDGVDLQHIGALAREDEREAPRVAGKHRQTGREPLLAASAVVPRGGGEEDQVIRAPRLAESQKAVWRQWFARRNDAVGEVVPVEGEGRLAAIGDDALTPEGAMDERVDVADALAVTQHRRVPVDGMILPLGAELAENQRGDGQRDERPYGGAAASRDPHG